MQSAACLFTCHKCCVNFLNAIDAFLRLRTPRFASSETLSWLMHFGPLLHPLTSSSVHSQSLPCPQPDTCSSLPNSDLPLSLLVLHLPAQSYPRALSSTPPLQASTSHWYCCSHFRDWLLSSQSQHRFCALSSISSFPRPVRATPP